MWFKNTVHTIDPGKRAPIRLSVRNDTHIATLFKTLEAYNPSPNRDHSKNTYAVSLFLVPLDGWDPRLVPIGGALSGNAFGPAKILGSDRRTLWFDVTGKV